jgi:hypothetical protein
MADEKRERALRVFRGLCDNLDKRNWNYQKDEERLRIECTAHGDDLPMDLSIRVEADRQLLMLLSTLPFNVPEDKRLDLAIAITHVNDRLVDGSFDYNISDGRILFRLTSSFIDSEIGNDLFTYLVGCSCQTIDAFNDKLMKVALDMMGVEEFISNN